MEFRAWEDGANRMHQRFQFWKSGDDKNDWIVFISSLSNSMFEQVNNPYSRQQFHIMRHTGLFDLNNKAIFEGDVVKRKRFPRGTEVSVSKVIFENASFVLSPKITLIEDYLGRYSQREVEVIGNIYENPELINT